MANYLFALIKETDLPVVKELLLDDVHVEKKNGFAAVFHPASGWRGGSFFLGHALDHQNRRVIFSDAAERYYPRSSDHVEGAFIRCSVSKSSDKGIELECFGDLFGQVAKVYSAGRSFFFMSDSIALLCSARRVLGERNVLNREAFVSRLWLNGIATQPFSSSMVIEGVQLALPGQAICAHTRQSVIELSLSKTQLSDIFAPSERSYDDILIESARNIRDMIGSLASLEGACTSLDISGGLDSRVCLAGAASADCLSSLYIQSNRVAAEDFTIAEMLAQHLGITLNAPRAALPKSVRTIYTGSQFAQWGAFNIGLYDALYTSGSSHRVYSRFRIGGHGAELLKGNYGWRSLEAVAASAPSPIMPTIRHALTEASEEIGIAFDDPVGSEWHYLAYRNGIHSGRATMANLFSFRPMQQRSLVALSYSSSNPFPRPKVAEHSVVHDLLLCLSEDLAAMPFDKNIKNITTGKLRKRRRSLFLSDAFEPYAIKGSPLPEAIGPTRASLKNARAYGLDESVANVGMVAELLAQVRKRMPPDTQPILAPFLETASQVSSKSRPSSPESRSLGKLLSLLLVD